MRVSIHSLRWSLLLLVGFIGLAISSASWAGGPAPFMMMARVDNQLLEGQPLLWDSQHMFLLGRDGVLHEFPPTAAKQARKTKLEFSSYTSSEMQLRLRKEFGHRFEVRTTQHFVVAYPRDSRHDWAGRMETLYRSFVRSMRVRGISIQQPQVPLVAVVFRTQTDYYHHHQTANGTPLPANTLGHYEPKSNRIFLFDHGQAHGNTNTIIHEATHQTAYNVGVHRRFAEQPKWLVEGLAMMFETPGMREAWSIRTRKDRINHGRLDYFLQHLEQRSDDALLQLISSDQTFRTDPMGAYSEAWLLSFYLFETQPRKYSDYLARVAARPTFSLYSSTERREEFTHIFGSNLKLLDAQLLRYVEQLR
jgi:hypothetical protein